MKKAYTPAEKAEPAALVRHCEAQQATKQSGKSTVLTGLPRSRWSLAMTRQLKRFVPPLRGNRNLQSKFRRGAASGGSIDNFNRNRYNRGIDHACSSPYGRG
jgi:hypothetical protein